VSLIAPAPATAATADRGGGASRGDRVAGIIVGVIGLLCVAAGLLIMLGWYCRSVELLRWPGTDNPMVFSAALCLTATGVALAVLSKRWHPVVTVVAGLNVTLATLMLVGELLGVGIGLDDLFVTLYLGDGVGGRMGVNTAVCFILVSVGMLALAPWWPWPRQRAWVSGAAGSLISAIAMLSLFGHAAGLSAAADWGDEVSMGVYTGAALLVVALGLLVLTWLRFDRGGQWLAMPAAAFMLCAAVLVWMALSETSGEGGHLDRSSTIRAVAILGLITAFLVAFAVWMALRAERARRVAVASESRLFQFLNALPVGVSIRTTDGHVYYANSEAGRLWGPDMAEQAANGAALEVFQAYVQDGGPLYPFRDTAHASALRGERAHFDDMELRRPDGAIALEVWGTPIRDRAGAVEFTVAAFADISDRRAAERALSDQASLLELAHDAILVWDAGHVITFWNHGAERTYGFTRAEAVGRIATELLHTEYPSPGADLEAELDASGSWQGELVQTRKDGQRIVLASRWAGRPAPNGTRIATMEVNRDITAARNAERYARSLIEASQDPLVTVSPEGKITDFNQATIAGTGAQREEIIGTDFADYFIAPDRAQAAFHRVFTAGFIVDAAFAIRRTDGEIRDVLANAALYRDAGGTVLGIVATVHDITHRKRAEEERARRAAELEQANIALERSNAELEQFAYVASHDLSEPLRAISRPLSLMARRYQGRLDDQADEFIGFAVDGCERMQSLIDGLLTFSRVGRVQGDLVPTSVEVAVRGVLTALGPTLADTKASVTVGPLPVVMAEPTQLTQVFQNLISNAVKFAAPGVAPRVSVRAERCAEHWRFTVTDNGIGVEPRHRDRVFGMFKRLHVAEEYPGTGIGLALVKKIVECHGGQVGIDDSDAGAGSCVWFTLPADLHTEAAPCDRNIPSLVDSGYLK
jgi:PAS domain S-box-containing protein